MVDFMLQAATEQAVAFDDVVFAVEVGEFHHGVFTTTFRHRNARAGKAALFFSDQFAFEFKNFRIDERDGVLAAIFLVAVNHDDALKHAHLRCGNAAAVVLVHRFRHLLRELLQALVFDVALLAHLAKNGVGVFHHRERDKSHIQFLLSKGPRIRPRFNKQSLQPRVYQRVTAGPTNAQMVHTNTRTAAIDGTCALGEWQIGRSATLPRRDARGQSSRKLQ